MRWSVRDLNCCELVLTASDGDRLQWYFLVGWINGRPAIAEWDGDHLRMSRNLADVVSLADAVDRALDGCVEQELDDHGSWAKTPQRALLRLAECCEGIYVLETVDHKGHRTWA